MRIRLPLLFLALLLPLLAGCSTLGYYSQAIRGHLDLMQRARPVDDLLADESAPEALRRRLHVAQRVRLFAFRDLGLPRSESYSRYVELGRPVVTWNVIATPALSIAPVQSCYPIAGCFSYRGYFSRSEAKRHAEDLRLKGYDTYVAGATAYSTLGWFDDPLLSSMVERDEEEMVATLFHELAHRKLYLPGDVAFNEAFATVVADEGVKRWYRGTPEQYARYAQRQRRLQGVTALLLDARRRLERLYAEVGKSDEEKLREKRACLNRLREDYARLKEEWGGDKSFDAWFPPGINNAHLALTATYHELVPGLVALLAESDGNLEIFYASAASLARLTSDERHARLTDPADGPAVAGVTDPP